MPKKFWAWDTSESGEPELRLEGEIASESWWGDEVTPAAFRADLAAHKGAAITVWINSPGGDVFAGSAIYTALKEYPGRVTVKVDGIAASSASVVAMAADEILMSPTATMMIHNPWTFALGDAREFERQAAALRECADGLINAYVAKTGLPRDRIVQLMDDETYMSAGTAIKEGFADGLLYAAGNKNAQASKASAFLYSGKGIRALASKLAVPAQPEAQPDPDAAERAQLIATCRETANKLIGGNDNA